MLCDEEYFSALTDYRNSKPTVMDLIAKTMTKQLLPIAGAKCDIGKVVRSTLKSNKLSNSYSLEATKRKLQPKSFDECCALDYYLRDSYAKRFHAYIIYRFFLFVQTKNEKLRSVTTSAYNCIVCLERAARTAQEGGEPVLWRQAEPCLHWTCDSCTRKLIWQGGALIANSASRRSFRTQRALLQQAISRKMHQAGGRLLIAPREERM